MRAIRIFQRYKKVYATRCMHSQIWLMLVLCIPVLSFAQSKSELEARRKKITTEITVTSKLLNKTTQQKEATYERFVTLQTQIERRENLIQVIENEIVAADSLVVQSTLTIETMQADIERMREDYARTLRTAYRRKSLSSPLLFLLSADNLNQAFRRWLFLRKYDQYRKGQADALAMVQEQMRRRIEDIQRIKQEKTDLLSQMQGQQGRLAEEMTNKNDLLQSLTKDEARLQQDLQKKQAARAQLDAAIDRIISDGIAVKTADDKKKKQEKQQKKEEGKTVAATKPVQPKDPPPTTNTGVTKTTPTNPTVSTPQPLKPSTNSTASQPLNSSTVTEYDEAEEDQVSKDFKRHRGRLPSPVENGVITRRFGRQKHPTLKNIEITNNGVDIRTVEDTPVHAVFEGKVAGVQYIPGHDYTVIIQHGDYYTVYANMSSTTLSKGDLVAEGQTLGRVSTNPISGAAELHFELWHEKERENPASWLK
jgi:murein hydrolase activator